MQFERQTEAIEVSVVIPCLNEEDTLASCIEKAQRALREHNIVGEIVVADNGSTDSSRTIAERQGTRVITVKEPGYGNVLMGGIAAATGRKSASLDQVESFSQFFNDLRDLKKIVTVIGIPYDDE